MTVGEWLDTWLELYVEPSDLAQNTKACYTRSCKAVPPALRDRDICSLTALDVRKWLLDVAKTTPRAAQLDRVTLSKSLRIAAKLGLCKPGIIDADTCPQIRHSPKETKILNVDQLKAYMAAVCQEQSSAAIALAFCALGMRRGEARGVTWADVDLTQGIVYITGQRQGMGEKTPCKTKASRRAIEMPDCVLVALKRATRGVPWVFVAPDSESALYRLHRAILSRCGLPMVTLHSLRHSVATALVEGGRPVKAVQGLLGHAHYQITADIYANHLPSTSVLCKHLFS